MNKNQIRILIFFLIKPQNNLILLLDLTFTHWLYSHRLKSSMIIIIFNGIIRIHDQLPIYNYQRMQYNRQEKYNTHAMIVSVCSRYWSSGTQVLENHACLWDMSKIISQLPSIILLESISYFVHNTRKWKI